jgi:2-(1,2-epoxy-1,2-dihydrophenyl)acetyl-CoA isomerase
MLLPRIIGAKRSNELFLYARNVNADEAKSLGLVNLVFDEEKFEEGLEKTIGQLKDLPMESIKDFKNLTNIALFAGLEEQLAREQTANCSLIGEPSFKKRLEAMFARK